MEELNQSLQNVSATTSKKGQKRSRKALHVLLVLFLMLISFIAGWRLMANRWWPVWGPYVKEAIYTIVPSLRPETAVIASESYSPRCDARVSDPIGATDSVFYYFYYPTCPYCSTYGNMILAGLPDFITLPDGSQSRVVMIPLNKHDDQDYVFIDAYYTKHNIVKNESQNDQVVPTIIIGDRYLCGSIEIRDNFYKLLLDGAGLTTELIDGSARTE